MVHPRAHRAGPARFPQRRAGLVIDRARAPPPVERGGATVSSSIDGLISGLSTSDLISKLMQTESAGQTRLKTKVNSQQQVITSLQSINTKVAALKTATAAATDALNWSSAKATSSSDAISVSAGSGATTGKLILDVKELAQVGVKTAKVAAATTDITDTTGLSITIGATTTQITPTVDTAQGVVDAINKAGIGVSATLVNSSDNGTILQLTGTKTGTDNEFSVSGLTPALTQISAAANARIQVGNPASGGYSLTSSTNTFTNVLPNVTLTANKMQDGITVTVGSDVDTVASKVQAMVDAANNLMTEAGTQTAIKTSATGTVSGNALSGNLMVRQLQQSVLSSVTNGMADFGSFKQIGVQTDRYGKLTFDKVAFTAAYTADPTKTQNAISNGIGKAFTDLTTRANTDITSVIQSGNNTIRGLNDQIDNWSVRLQIRQATLQRQFTNLEVALGKMKDQSSWLAGQISALG